jgi:hypothetical protein
VSVATGNRPRVLVVESDAQWRRRLRDHVGSALGTAEAATAEEAVGWLEGRAPGLTVLGVAAEDPLAEETVARIRELHPSEVVVVATEKPTVELCRRVMRVGAFDVLSRVACLGAGFERTLADAGRKLHSVQSRRRRSYDMAREAISRHERHATAQLLEGHAVSGVWSQIDPTVRRAWVHRYANAAAADAAERATFLQEILEELAGFEGAAELAVALHVQAVTTVHSGPAGEVPPGSRNLLIDLLGALAEQAERGAASTTPAGDPQALWHRWRLADAEYWWLVVDGRLRAQVRVGAAGVDGRWLPEPGSAQLRTSGLPGLPEALREIERRVGCPYVLDVAPAEEP